jgi:hypothetical protein
VQLHSEGGRPLAVELARYVTNDAFIDNVWEAYHCVTWLSDSACLGLVAEDSTEMIAVVAGEGAPLLLQPWSAGVEERPDGAELLGKGCLPAYVAP